MCGEVAHDGVVALRCSVYDPAWLDPDVRSVLLDAIRNGSADAARALLDDWRFWSRPDQRPPRGAWRTWLLLGGRGAGKTRAGAEWVRSEVENGRRGRFALVGSALGEVREVMIDGPSGLRAIGGADGKPRYEATRRRLVWPNGAVAHAFSAEDPDALRGPQFSGAWLDEVAAWRDAPAAYDTLQFGLRLGDEPRQVITTTPRSIPLLRRILDARDTVTTRAATVANIANLAPGFVDAMNAAYAGSRLGRQELEGELLDDVEGALWSRALIEGAFDPSPPMLERVVIGVDPPAGEGENADACGVIAAGAAGEGRERRVWVLADRTIQGVSPTVWAERVVATARDFDADYVVAEVNQGGALVRTLIEIADPTVVVREVRASVGKQARAEPVAILYEHGRVLHAGRFPALEDQMCQFGASGAGRASPDRVDALVWAVSALVLGRAEQPRLRTL
jgi:phage terminase large subunit-like protein